MCTHIHIYAIVCMCACLCTCICVDVYLYMYLYVCVCVCVCVCLSVLQIQLTLFLKDLGLPVHQAVALWQQEYSLPSKAGSSCNHSWQSDGRRYTYSIRHLYGLEGARRNYRSYCCDTLQVDHQFSVCLVNFP